MAGVVIRLGRVICCVIALTVVCVGLFSHMPEDSRRQLGERFSAAVEAPSNGSVDTYFAPDSAAYLPGATIPLSPSGLRGYLQRQRGQKQLFHRVSNVFVTPTGFGWLLVIQRAPDQLTDATSESSQRPLWLEGTIQNDRITRVWMHYTIEALIAVGEPVETYRASVAARQLPLPANWENGTPALLAAAERTDQQAHDDMLMASSASGPGALLGSALVLALVFASGARRILRPEPVVGGQLHNGHMLLELRKARGGAVSLSSSAPGVPGEPLAAAAPRGDRKLA